MITTINPKMGELPWPKFKAWHDKFMSADEMTAEERYQSLGGKVPEKKVEKKEPSK
jgi:hypothetical protein